jgi:hypothetical protein
MSEAVAILTVAALAVVFGMLSRRRGSCPGPQACDQSNEDEPGGCRGCGLPSESKHART